MAISKRRRQPTTATDDDDAEPRSKILKALNDLDGSATVDGSPAAPATETADDHATSDSDGSPVGSSGADEVPNSLQEVFEKVSGKNLFAYVSTNVTLYTTDSKYGSSLFPDNKAVLKGALAVTSNKNGTAYEFSGIPTFNILQAHRPTEALRLLKCASHADNTSLKVPAGGIINVALADPSTLAFDPETGYLCNGSSKAWVMSSLLGQTVYFSQGKIAQICVTPSAHGWHRLVAVLAEVSGHNMMYFQSFRGGITFGTNRWKSNGIGTGGTPKKGRVAPIRGSLIAKEQNIPVFDGRTGFQLGNYWETPYPDEVSKDSTVMLLFSIKKGNLAKEMQKAPNVPEGVEFAVYFNILGIVLLAEPAEKFSEAASGEAPEAFGVEGVPEYSEYPEQAEAEEAATVESDIEELEEPVL